MAGLAVVAIIWFTGDDSADVTAAESEPAVQADPDDPVDALDDGVGVEEADLAVQNIEAQPHLILSSQRRRIRMPLMFWAEPSELLESGRCFSGWRAVTSQSRTKPF